MVAVTGIHVKSGRAETSRAATPLCLLRMGGLLCGLLSVFTNPALVGWSVYSTHNAEVNQLWAQPLGQGPAPDLEIRFSSLDNSSSS